MSYEENGTTLNQSLVAKTRLEVFPNMQSAAFSYYNYFQLGIMVFTKVQVDCKAAQII